MLSTTLMFLLFVFVPRPLFLRVVEFYQLVRYELYSLSLVATGHPALYVMFMDKTFTNGSVYCPGQLRQQRSQQPNTYFVQKRSWSVRVH